MVSFSMIFICLLAVITVVTFLLYGLDKGRAVRHERRIPESTLLLFSLFGGIGAFFGMLVFRHKTRKWKFRILVPLFMIAEIAAIALLFWTAGYYDADETALAALASDDSVRVEETGYGWSFDGPSEEAAFIFYPGAKVDEKAYAPLMRRVAEEAADVYIMKVPLRFALAGTGGAYDVIAGLSCSHCYIGGHSLGGVAAASYAAKHEDQISGVIFLASYPAEEIPEDALLIYGSEDTVLNMDGVRQTDSLVSGECSCLVIEGGNHAQFGNYGPQKGDGTAAISAVEQQERAAEAIRAFVGSR